MAQLAAPSTPIHRRAQSAPVHDDETVRVAEELMLLSASRSQRMPLREQTDGNVGKSRQHAITESSKTFPSRKRQKALGAQFEQAESPAFDTRARGRCDRPSALSTENIINSRCDAPHAQLLAEHRSRFRKVRRRWNIASVNKRKAYMARFQIQGIPLVKHLESRGNWR
ncbi:hypothetical protein PINS_up008302 [Pythium insidiosum]|nr:hypothetical protein PINS_up008302 [Pythium insidiosum]